MGKLPKRSRTRLRIDSLDQRFSKCIRLRDKKCQRCGSRESLQCMHLVSRRYMGTRFDPDNALTGCAACHVYLTYRPLEHDEFVVAKVGQEKYDALKAKAREYEESVRKGADKIDRSATSHWLTRWLRELGG